MSDAITARTRLQEYADDLDDLSKRLADVQRELEPLERDYTDSVADSLLAQWHDHVQTGAKLPNKEVQQLTAERTVEPGLYARRLALLHSRDRLQKRISDLKASIEAQRSILSALKLEVESTQ